MEEEVKDIEARRQIEVMKEVLKVLVDEKRKETHLRKLDKALSGFPRINIVQEMPE